MTAIRNGAFWLGWSLHGNQVGAPLGWPATSTPSVSSSQPTSPHTDGAGRGLPE